MEDYKNVSENENDQLNLEELGWLIRVCERVIMISGMNLNTKNDDVAKVTQLMCKLQNMECQHPKFKEDVLKDINRNYKFYKDGTIEKRENDGE